MMLNPLLILYLKTQVLMLTGKLQCFFFLRFEEQRRNAGFVTLYLCATVKQWDIGIMLVIQHSVRMRCILC